MIIKKGNNSDINNVNYITDQNIIYSSVIISPAFKIWEPLLSL